MQTNEVKLQKAELIISNILRWGVFTCAAVILTGWILGNHPIIMAGLLMLILLPLSRVFAAGILFIMQKDYIYVALSFYVLAILAISLLLGKAL